MASRDPNYDKVVLLLSKMGDYSPTQKAMTLAGGITCPTDVGKFGYGSMYFNGSGASIRCSHSDFALGTGDFTIDFWIYPINGGHGNNYSRILQTQDYGTSGGITIACNSSDNPAHITMQGSASGQEDSKTSSMTIANSTWTHVEISRASGTQRTFVNGALACSTAYAYNYTKSSLSIGANSNGGEAFYGNLCELRITKGTARHTAEFTAPTSSILVPVLADTRIGSAALSGNATKSGGGAVDIVIVRDYDAPRGVVASVIPASNGNWSASVPPGRYDVTYISDGCAPICHGPYTVT